MTIKYPTKILICISCMLLSVLMIGCHGLFGGKNPPVEISDDKALLNEITMELRARFNLLGTLSTAMNVMIETKEGKQEIREHLRYKRPDKLRINAYGPLGGTRAIALTTEKTFTLYYVPENEAIKAPLTDEVLTKIFGMDLRISDIRSAIFANPLLDGNIRNIQVISTDGKYLLTRPSSRQEHREEIIVATKKDEFIVTDWKILDSMGNIAQHIEFKDYREVGGIVRPLKVSIRRPAEGTLITFQSVRPEVNADIKDKFFHINLPDGTKITTLE